MVSAAHLNPWRSIDCAPTNQRVLIEGRNHLGADEMAMAWLDRIDQRWYYAPQGGLVQWSPIFWQSLPQGAKGPIITQAMLLKLVDAAKALQHASEGATAEDGVVYKQRAAHVFGILSILAGGAGSAFTWPPKACPCASVQCEKCREDGCQWTRDPSLVPEHLRSYPMGSS